MTEGPQTASAIDWQSPAGELALLPPDSVQWRIYKNPIAMGVGGVAAVLLEFADARIRSGVWDHSIYKQDPIGRSTRTGIAALVGVYGPASAARRVIQNVNRMHSRVKGTTPSGEAYKALDPELLAWVSATAGYGFVKAYDRFVARISAEDEARYYRDGGEIAKLYGVRDPIVSSAEFHALMDRLAPRFEPHPIVHEFLAIIQSGTAAPSIPRFLHRALARAAVSLLPPIVRTRLELGRGYDLTLVDRLALKAAARVAERRFDPASPQCQSCLRIGLPADFLYRSPAEQRRLLAGQGSAQAAAPATRQPVLQ